LVAVVSQEEVARLIHMHDYLALGLAPHLGTSGAMSSVTVINLVQTEALSVSGLLDDALQVHVVRDFLPRHSALQLDAHEGLSRQPRMRVRHLPQHHVQQA
jgi:hypothetical protein